MASLRLVNGFALGAVLVLLAACGMTSAPNESVNLANGEGKGYRITCGGALSSVNDCYKQAGIICGNKGYMVMHEVDIAPPGDSNYFWNAAAHETIIKCNPTESSSSAPVSVFNPVNLVSPTIAAPNAAPKR